jgi:hypothetical protein
MPGGWSLLQINQLKLALSKNLSDIWKRKIKLYLLLSEQKSNDVNYLSGDITDTYSVQKNCVPKCVLEPVRLPLQYGRVELASLIADMLVTAVRQFMLFLKLNPYQRS